MAEELDVAGSGGRNRRRVLGVHRAVPWYRSAVFGVLVLGLVGSIPVLAWGGVRMIRHSNLGTYHRTVNNPKAPGYQALVDPTSVALVIQRDDAGNPVSLTMFALGGSREGGSILFIPLDTKLPVPAYGADRLRSAFGVATSKAAQDNLVDRTADVLNVGFTDVIDLKDADFERLTAKVGPLQIQNPDSGVQVDGTTFPSGPLSLQPAQVGPFLRASVPFESDLNRLNRQGLVWQAWLAAIAKSKDPGVVPGETQSGIGLYLLNLARGPIDPETLPVLPDPFSTTGLLVPDGPRVSEIVTSDVPFPISPHPGVRPVLRLLDGVNGDGLTTSQIQPFVAAGGTIKGIGNGPKFGQETTVFEYLDPAQRNRAEFLRAALGGKGTLRFNPRASDDVDITVIIGSDLLDSPSANHAGNTVSLGGGTGG
ncbi:MAG TPA: LytR C-terminal domain-containing protein [Acidimicrobiales bacterium]